MCQEAGSAISIDALNYPPTVVAQVVLIRSNYGCRNVYVMYVCELQKKLRVLQAMHGGLRSVWLPSQGGSTGSWHGTNYPMAEVRTFKPPWRSATRCPALVCAPGPGGGKVMTADETTYGGTFRLWRPSKGGSTSSWYDDNQLILV